MSHFQAKGDKNPGKFVFERPRIVRAHQLSNAQLIERTLELEVAGMY